MNIDNVPETNLKRPWYFVILLYYVNFLFNFINIGFGPQIQLIIYLWI